MKLTKYANTMTRMYNELVNEVEKLELKRDAIEDKALEKDRDMTDKEQERYDAIDGQIDELNDIMDDIDSLISRLEYFGEE